MRVVVIGGHGRIALLLQRLLTQRGHEVTSAFRDPEHTAEVAATGAHAVVADVETMDTGQIAELLSGHDALVWSAGAGGGNPRRTYAVDRDAAIRSMDAAAAAGVPRYVMVSYVRSGRDRVAPEDSFFPYADAKAAADEHLRGTNLRWTILGPGLLTSEPPTGAVTAGPEVTDGEVSRANVAELAAQVLERTDLDGVTVNFVDGDVPISQALDAAARP